MKYEFNPDGSIKIPKKKEFDFERVKSSIKPDRMEFFELINDLDKGVLVVPAFQRGIVWNLRETIDLLDSIYKGYPIGSFLIWDAKKELEYVKQVGDYKLKEPNEESPFLSYILDGQQRILSIYACLREIRIKNKDYRVYFDLDDERFVDENEYEPEKQVSFSDAIGENHLQISRSLTPERQVIFERLYRAFTSYNFSIIRIKDQPIEIVSEIFERINNTGRKLTVVDLVVAKTWDTEFDLRAKLETYKSKLKLKNFTDIDERNILQCVSIHNFKRCHRRDILKIDKKILKECWDQSLDSIDLAIDFVKSNINIRDSKILPYPSLIVGLSYFFYNNKSPNQQQLNSLIKWFWRGSLSNRYDQGVDSRIAEDVKEFDKLLINQKPDFNFQVSFTFETIKKQKFSTGSAFAKAILSLLAYLKPKDWKNNSELDLNGVFSDYNLKEMHHIYPKSILIKKGVDNNQINSLPNLCFLPSKLNKELKDKNPAIYVDELINDNQNLNEALESHLIKLEWLKKNFEEFTELRAKWINSCLRELADLEQPIESSFLISPTKPYSNRKAFSNLLKDAQNYIFWVDKYFSKKGLDLILDNIENNSKVKEIKILTSSESVDSNFKELFKHFRKELIERGVSCEIRVFTDGKIKSQIHDRWLITSNFIYNIPSVDVMARGQFSEILSSNQKIPFTEWWEVSKDILEDWNEININ